MTTVLVSSGSVMAFAMALDEQPDCGYHHLLDFSSNYSFNSDMTTTTSTTANSTTTTSSDEFEGVDGCNWKDTWSPVIDWDALSNGRDEFQDLMESMMVDVDEQGSNSAISASAADDVMIGDEATAGGEDDVKGLRLVHLLMAAAEALFGSNRSRDLAQVILVRLKELVSPTDGTNIERLAAYFTEALQVLLDATGGSGKHMHILNHGTGQFNQADMVAAFQLLQDMSPVVKFGHFTANQAILEHVSHDRRIHIVDYDIMEGIQWASLMQALVSRKEGPPAPHLRITALSRGGGGGGRRSFGTVQETGRRLAAFAASIGQPFSFHQCRLDSDEAFRPSALKLVRGEALIFNCMLHLPHSVSYRAPDSVASFLTGAKSLNPRLLTVVEEEVGPIGETGCLGRFMDSLHHYSAIYDLFEAGFPLQNGARELVERVFLGPRISGTVTRIYRSMGEKERGPWGELLSEIGFSQKSISFANHCQAKLLLGLFNDGYSVEELDKHRLVLKWKSRRLLSASTWCSPSDQSP